MADTKHKCPVCGKFEFSDKDSYEVCEVCGWGDDDLQECKPDFKGGFNHMSLNEAKEAYKAGKKVV